MFTYWWVMFFVGLFIDGFGILNLRRALRLKNASNGVLPFPRVIYFLMGITFLCGTGVIIITSLEILHY